MQVKLNFVSKSFNFGNENQVCYLNHILFFILPCSKASKETSVSSIFDTVSSILDNVKGEGCRQSSARVRGVDTYKRKGAFKANVGGK